ncbi:MAG: hypothetical protein H7Z74_07740 [Anaerolineae bacterium]|nr:hypothetical protein [Gemmatimonadaceae bacterium]
METHGPLGTIWVGLGLSAFYIGLIWINSLLGLFLTPLFIIPITWFIGGKKRDLSTPDSQVRSKQQATRSP